MMSWFTRAGKGNQNARSADGIPAFAGMTGAAEGVQSQKTPAAKNAAKKMLDIDKRT
jgi:hypothetical protein